MGDIVNAYFQQFYPADAADCWETHQCGGGCGRRYTGTEKRSNIFPAIVCADGLSLSVQGHFGAYSYPRDDFADSYEQVEIMGPPNIAELMNYQPCEVGEQMIYAYVPVHLVVSLIEQHGGIAPTPGDPA